MTEPKHEADANEEESADADADRGSGSEAVGAEAAKAETGDLVFDTLWKRVLEAWDDDKPHVAILDYAIRGLYAEISNIQQLRDEIASGTTRDPIKRVRRAKGQIRRRAPRDLS